MSALRTISALALAAAPAIALAQAEHPIAHATKTTVARQAQAQAPIARAEFHDAMRKLWEDHVTWTRLYIVSAIAGLPDAQPTAERLLANQADLGNAIKPFYGAAAGDKLTSLLRPHILIAAELVTAAKSGNTAAIQSASKRWYANADEIADFLSGANEKNWPRAVLRAEMKHHLDLTLEEAQARLAGNWAKDIATYDKIHVHILKMADVLSSGIINQFPTRFK